jgi:predicted Fe-Mo cluster-binding NifX family protein
MRLAVASQDFRTVTPHAGKTRRFVVYAVEPFQEPVEVDRLDLPKEMTLHEFHGDHGHPLYTVDVVIAASFGEGFKRRMAKHASIAERTEKSDRVVAVKDFLASPVGRLEQSLEMGRCWPGVDLRSSP